MTVRLIALDLDGTLLDGEKRIPAATRQALRTAADQGVAIVLASGRMTPCITPVGDQLELDGPLISYNGARVVGSTAQQRRVLWHQPLPTEFAGDLINYHQANGVQLNLYLDDTLYSVDHPEMRPLLDLYCRRTGSQPVFVESLDQFRDREPTKLILLAENHKRDALYEEFKARYGDRMWIVKSDPEYLEFLHPEVNKGVALQALCDELGIDIADTMACGDGDNDADMLMAAGIGVAMANGSDVCKSVAQYVTQNTNDDDGVAEAVEKFVLQTA